MSEFRMPSLGADMEAGTLVEWLKQPGQRVQRGEAIAAVETQKGAIEVEAFESGVLREIRVPLGEKVPVGTVLAIIDPDGDSGAAPVPADTARAAARAPAAAMPAPAMTAMPAAPAAGAAAPAPVPAGTPRISPAALRRMLELGLDARSVPPGDDGVVGLREVAAAQAARDAAAPAVAVPASPDGHAGLDLAEMRRAIAAAMARSWREIPHYFVSSDLDVGALLDWLRERNAARAQPERLHYAAALIKAVALALEATPALNGRYGERGFEPAATVNLGIAVAMRGGGLIAPAILDAQRLDLDALMARLDDLVSRVRGGRLRSSELMAGTATLSNLGEESADSVQPVIYPPQVAIIGCGQIVERACARAGRVEARPMLTVTVGGDHRVSDGRSAARFLRRLDALLQQPGRL